MILNKSTSNKDVDNIPGPFPPSSGDLAPECFVQETKTLRAYRPKEFVEMHYSEEFEEEPSPADGGTPQDEQFEPRFAAGFEDVDEMNNLHNERREPAPRVEQSLAGVVVKSSSSAFVDVGGPPQTTGPLNTGQATGSAVSSLAVSEFRGTEAKRPPSSTRYVREIEVPDSYDHVPVFFSPKLRFYAYQAPASRRLVLTVRKGELPPSPMLKKILFLPVEEQRGGVRKAESKIEL